MQLHSPMLPPRPLHTRLFFHTNPSFFTSATDVITALRKLSAASHKYLPIRLHGLPGFTYPTRITTTETRSNISMSARLSSPLAPYHLFQLSFSSNRHNYNKVSCIYVFILAPADVHSCISTATSSCLSQTQQQPLSSHVFSAPLRLATHFFLLWNMFHLLKLCPPYFIFPWPSHLSSSRMSLDFQNIDCSRTGLWPVLFASRCYPWNISTVSSWPYLPHLLWFGRLLDNHNSHFPKLHNQHHTFTCTRQPNMITVCFAYPSYVSGYCQRIVTISLIIAGNEPVPTLENISF